MGLACASCMQGLSGFPQMRLQAMDQPCFTATPHDDLSRQILLWYMYVAILLTWKKGKLVYEMATLSWFRDPIWRSSSTTNLAEHPFIFLSLSTLSYYFHSHTTYGLQKKRKVSHTSILNMKLSMLSYSNPLYLYPYGVFVYTRMVAKFCTFQLYYTRSWTEFTRPTHYYTVCPLRYISGYIPHDDFLLNSFHFHLAETILIKLAFFFSLQKTCSCVWHSSKHCKQGLITILPGLVPVAMVTALPLLLRTEPGELTEPQCYQPTKNFMIH